MSYSLDGGPEQTATNPASVSISGDAVHLLTYHSTDLATNAETAKSLEIKIDSTPPNVTASCSPAPNANGWNNTDVLVTFHADDALSGVAQLDAPMLVTEEGAGVTCSGSATDAAGNVDTVTVTMNIDKTAPVVSGSVATIPVYTDGSGNEWFAGDAQVAYTARDDISGLQSPTAAGSGVEINVNHTVTGEGAGLSDSLSVTDKADNSATATVSGINIDRTGPTITITGVTNGATYPLGGAPTPAYSAVDGLSGLKTSYANLQGPGTASGAGVYIYTVNAEDNVGNRSSVVVTYSVVYPTFVGILQPINLDGSSIFKLG
ncbi:MAG: hypothetical protein Q7R41_13930, partial [Phycisphaerales bacterium]|nr:hypothetical protein [Phycisphaerales bacterium]